VGTSSLSIDGYAVPFRAFGSLLLDQPIPKFTGTKKVKVQGIADDQTVTLTVTEPLPCTVLHITTYVKVRGDINAPSPH
jgi:hypothetical protein